MTFLGSAFLLLAAISAGTIIWQVVQQYAASRLPKAPGIMLSCDPVLSQSPDLPTSGNTPRSASMWTVKARYRYTVGGVSFDGKVFSQRKVGKISNRATFEDPAPESIAQLCGSYPAGSTVQVYYHPDDPQNSFIYFNPPATDWPWLIVPLAAITVSLLFFFLARLARKTG